MPWRCIRVCICVCVCVYVFIAVFTFALQAAYNHMAKLWGLWKSMSVSVCVSEWNSFIFTCTYANTNKYNITSFLWQTATQLLQKYEPQTSTDSFWSQQQKQRLQAIHTHIYTLSNTHREFITFTCKLRQTTLLCKLPTANGERNWFSRISSFTLVFFFRSAFIHFIPLVGHRVYFFDKNIYLNIL